MTLLDQIIDKACEAGAASLNGQNASDAETASVCYFAAKEAADEAYELAQNIEPEDHEDAQTAVDGAYKAMTEVAIAAEQHGGLIPITIKEGERYGDIQVVHTTIPHGHGNC